MSSIDEKRVHAPNADATTLFVASETGLARVAVAGARIGGIELADRTATHDLALHDGRLAIATDEDVSLGVGADAEPTGFGRATAVGSDGTLLAAAPDGSVARQDDDGEWKPVGSVEEPRAIDGDFVAAADGVHRCSETGCEHVGLVDARDVAAGTPHTATADGLYRLGNGWLRALDGSFAMVSADRSTAESGALGRAHAASGETLYRHADSEWTIVDAIEEEVVDVAYGETGTETGVGSVYAVTADGRLLAETDDGWRDHPLGLRGVRAAVARPDRKPV